VVRAGLSPRLLLDLAGFVPVVGDAVDAVNAVVYLAQGRGTDGLLTAAAALPGPGGWVAGGAKVGKALDHAGDIAKVVDDAPAETRAIEVLSQLTVRGDRRTTRLLPDDESIERLYRDHLAGLGPTTIVKAGNETVSVTMLPSGAKIAFRRFSNSEGYAIEVEDLPQLGYDRVHRPRD